VEDYEIDTVLADYASGRATVGTPVGTDAPWSRFRDERPRDEGHHGEQAPGELQETAIESLVERRQKQVDAEEGTTPDKRLRKRATARDRELQAITDDCRQAYDAADQSRRVACW
jgi:hypothetical protein